MINAISQERLFHSRQHVTGGGGWWVQGQSYCGLRSFSVQETSRNIDLKEIAQNTTAQKLHIEEFAKWNEIKIISSTLKNRLHFLSRRALYTVIYGKEKLFSWFSLWCWGGRISVTTSYCPAVELSPRPRTNLCHQPIPGKVSSLTLWPQGLGEQLISSMIRLSPGVERLKNRIQDTADFFLYFSLIKNTSCYSVLKTLSRLRIQSFAKQLTSAHGLSVIENGGQNWCQKQKKEAINQ